MLRTASIIIAFATALAAGADRLTLGDPASEKAHALASENSAVRTGGLSQTCRVILPREPATSSGGSITFTLQCDPDRQNYLTARLWGDDVGETTLYIYHDGKQLGSKHSDWPPLDTLNWREKEPRFPARFFYSTYILPLYITQGKSRITLQIASKGFSYGYAPSYEKAQHKQTTPSQGIYAVTVHTDPFYTPPLDEVQGGAAPIGPITKRPSDLDPYEYVKRDAQRRIDGALRRELPRPKDILGIAMACNAPWAAQHKDKAILDRVLTTVDTYVQRDDVKALGWFGAGELAEAVWRVFDDAQAAGALEQKGRRKAYAAFFRKAIDHQTVPKHRGGLANQEIYIFTSVARSNRLLERLDPSRALPKAVVLDYVYQAMGLRPTKTRFIPGKGVQQSTAYRFIVGGPVFLSDDWDYYWVTPKASSKEHGFVPAYGEMAQQTATLYAITGDGRVKAQAIRMIAARTPFRVPSNDRDGNATVRIEAVIGWRHAWYAGRVEYGDQYLKAAALFGDPVSVRLAQLYVQHNMIYREPYRGTLPLLVQRVDYVKRVLAMPPSAFRLPMRDDQPDFAWADEGLRTLAFKHRGRRCWMTMNWRGAGINRMARVHYTEPTVDRIASMRIGTEFTPRGESIVRPKEAQRQFVEPGAALVTDGEALPLAAGPLGGMGDFYTARYGDYLIGMNCSKARTFRLAVPPEHAGRAVTDLITGRPLAPATAHAVKPGATMILYLPDP
ncbi:hypothetical protein HQ560_11590 [bacterium]|nr:hypothetical protein [bacterium]